MRQKKMRPAPLAKVAGLGISLSWAERSPELSFTLPAAQAAFLARFGLDATRARVVAELAGWRS